MCMLLNLNNDIYVNITKDIRMHERRVGQLEYWSIQGASVAMVTMFISPHSPASIVSVGSTQLSVSPNTGCICGKDGRHREENGTFRYKITEIKCAKTYKMQVEIFRMLKLNDQSGVLILLANKLFCLIQICRNWLSVRGNFHSNAVIHHWNFRTNKTH